MHRKVVESDADGVCVHEFEYWGDASPALAAGHMDVSARADGPFVGKVYDTDGDRFTDAPAKEG